MQNREPRLFPRDLIQLALLTIMALAAAAFFVGQVAKGPTYVDIDEARGLSATLPKFVVNVNAASVEELAALPGISRNLAVAIVEYRENNGEFASPGDLLNVRGIGAKRLASIVSNLEGFAIRPESPAESKE